MSQDKRRSGNPLQRLLVFPFVAAGVWVGFSKFIIDHDLPLPEAMAAKRVVFRAKTNTNINYYVDKNENGKPLVLVHGMHVAASAYDVLPLFEYYRTRRSVYALELPGFGFSERPGRRYTPQYYAETIINFLETQVVEPADVLALGQSSEFVARAASAMPVAFRTLSLVSPSGLDAKQNNLTKNKREMISLFAGIMNNPFWSQAVFDLFVTKPLLERRFQSKFFGQVPRGYLDYAYATTHQLGAANAPLANFSGHLKTKDISSRFYERVDLPVMVIYDRDPFTGFDQLPNLLNIKSNWHGVRIPSSKGMPQFDNLMETTKTLDNFWDSS